MRIQQVLLTPQIGGAESLAAALADVWTSLAIPNTIHYLDSYQPAPRSRLKRVVGMWRAAKAFQPDVIVAHTALPSLYARIGSSRAIPKVIVLHSSARDYDTRSLRIAERLLRSRTQYVVGVGPAQIEEYSHRFGHSTPMSVIRNGVRRGLPSRHGASNGISIVTLARVALVKNPALWQHVAVALQPLTDVNLVWWGPITDDYSQQLADAHRHGHMAGRFAGATTEPGRILSESSILFHPSDRESNGLSVVEAACVGIPVVCSDAVAAVLPADLDVVTFAAGDPRAAVDALTQVIEHYPAHVSRAQRQAPIVRQMFGIERCAELYLHVCRMCLVVKP